MFKRAEIIFSLKHVEVFATCDWTNVAQRHFAEEAF